MSDPEQSLFIDRPVYPGHGRNCGDQLENTVVRKGDLLAPGTKGSTEEEVRGAVFWGRIGDLPPVMSAERDTVIEEVQGRDARSESNRIILRFGCCYCTLTDHPGRIRPLRWKDLKICLGTGRCLVDGVGNCFWLGKWISFLKAGVWDWYSSVSDNQTVAVFHVLNS